MVVQIRANRPSEVPITQSAVTRLDRASLPISGVYSSFHNFQVYNRSLLLQFSNEDLDLNLQLARFSLFDAMEDDVSLSWHLTNKEKKRIMYLR